MLILKDGTVHSALLGLIRLSGLPVTDESPATVNELLQANWKAADGMLRAEIEGRFPTDEERVLIDQLGMGAIPIDFAKKYKGTIILGATIKAVLRRVWFLLQEEKRSGLVIPQPVYLFGSSRALLPKQEMPEHMPAIVQEVGCVFKDNWQDDAECGSWPKDEMRMMEKVIQEWFFISSDRWKTVSVKAPDGVKDGKPRPANTPETAAEWYRKFGQEFEPGSRFLVVSSQPFCENQVGAVSRAIKEAGGNFEFDVCGPAAPPLPIDRLKDNFAKALWEEIQKRAKV